MDELLDKARRIVDDLESTPWSEWVVACNAREVIEELVAALQPLWVGETGKYYSEVEHAFVSTLPNTVYFKDVRPRDSKVAIIPWREGTDGPR